MVSILSKTRNPMSGFTHFIAAILAVAGLVMLILRGVELHNVWQIVSFSIYGGSMIMLYTSSTLYHWLPLDEDGVAKMRKVDHMMIFFLIAGTYTPICLVSLRGVWGFTMFGIIWGFALAGLLSKIFWMNAPRWFYVGIYLVMGWVALIFMVPIVRNIPTGGLIFLVAGGVVYSVGAVIYALKKPNPFPEVFGFHEIWHLFVMGGSACHFFMIYLYVR